MIKINKHIEIVRTTTSRLSSMSQRSCDALVAVLSDHYATVGVTIVNTAADLERLAAYPPDLVFLGMKFVPANQVTDGPKIWLADYLDEHDIAYTGSNQSAHQLELNKPLAKQRALDAGLRTAPFYVIARDRTPREDNTSLEFPLFVKPTNRGGGLGIDSNSVVRNFTELRAKAMSIATRLQSDALVETYLPGREFSVALLQDECSPELLALPIELVAEADEHGARLLSGHTKSSNTEQVVAVTDKMIKAQVTALAADIFYALGARDYARIDIRLDARGTPHFLEANLIPSLISGYGSFPKACVLNIAMDYEAMILRIVELGLARSTDDIAADIPELVPISQLASLAPQL